MSTLIAFLRRRIAWPLAACAALAAGAPPASAASRELPPGIHQSLRESGRQLVFVVAADIDAEGDIDVVATDRALDLLVWVNDGTGRFTRKRPAPVRERHTGGPGPDVASHAPFGDVYTSSDPPSLDADVRSAIGGLFLSVSLIGLASEFADERARSTRRPRGPPAGTSLN